MILKKMFCYFSEKQGTGQEGGLHAHCATPETDSIDGTQVNVIISLGLINTPLAILICILFYLRYDKIINSEKLLR